MAVLGFLCIFAEKFKKKIMMKSFNLLSILMLLPLIASAERVEVNGIYYEFDTEAKTAKVQWSNNEYSGDIIIPEEVTYNDYTYKVTAIGGTAFNDCANLTSVTIPSSVTSVSSGAFYNCSNLTSVYISDLESWCNISFENDASNPLYYAHHLYINGEELKDLVIPNSITSISRDAFVGCSGLSSLTIPSSVTSIGMYAFRGCSGLTSIVVDNENTVYDSRDNCNAIIEKKSYALIVGCQNTTFPESIPVIGKFAFASCSSLTSLTIPDHISQIGSQAFSGSGLTSVVIGKGVHTIDDFAFSGCSSLTSIIVDSENTTYDSRDNCNAIIRTKDNWLLAGCKNTIIPSSVTAIGLYAFYECSGLSSLTIPSSVNRIGQSAFSQCSNLTSLTIPDGVTFLDFNIFNGCTSLTSVMIPSSVNRIYSWAFAGCGSLTSITIPGSVNTIDYDAFTRCSGLKDVFCYAENLPEIKTGNPFSNCPLKEMTLHVPAVSLEAYKTTAPWSSFGKIVAIEGTDTEGASHNEGVDEIIIKDIGKTTWCSEYDLDFTNVAGIKAYTATGYDDIDKTIWLTRVMKVPAGTGLLIKGDAGTYKVPHAKVRGYYKNIMKGNTGDPIQINETDGNMTNYYLSGKDGTFVSVNGSANIGKNKAYLQLPTSVFGGTRSIGISYDDEDGTTSIKNLAPALSEGEGEWFTLQGQRVAKPGKGLYIRNGKKVIVR